MALFIGIDIGTTHVKVIAADEISAIVCEEKTSYLLYQPRDGFCEQDADEIFTALLTTLKKVIVKINPREIETVCFSAAFHSIMAVDQNGRPLTPLLTWADTRANDYAKQLKKSGEGKIIYNKTGTPVHPMSPLCKIAWIRDHLPEVFAGTHKFISVKEYIWYKLFGKFQVDYSIASATGLFDSQNFQWCREALNFCGATSDSLSEPVSVLHKETKLNKEYQEELGLPDNLLFIIGAGDGAMANLGVGATVPGVAALTIGTSGAIRTATNFAVNDEKGRLFNYRLTDNLYITGGGINNGGIVLQWFVQTFLQKEFSSEKDYEWFFEEISQVVAGADGLIFLPYILGERAPVWDADAKGVFIGIRSTHTLKHFMRAVIEGVCFSLLQLLNTMEEKTTIDMIYVTGGVTQSPLWLQMLADILNKKIRVVKSADASAMGVVYLGMYAKGFIKEWNEIKKFALAETEFNPGTLQKNLYQTNISIFEHLYDKLKDDFEILSQPK
ncbi:MAG: gluconate kinase, family [Chitinophagaceae bacterium]|nr:gluconate kinase, family [Chitinophagaceae bacterium]